MAADYSLCLGTAGWGVWHSPDAGKSWTWHRAPFPLNSRIQALISHPTEPHTVFAGGDTGLFVSRNGGARWECLNANGALPTIWSLAIDPIDPEILFAGTQRGRSVSLPARRAKCSLARIWASPGRRQASNRNGRCLMRVGSRSRRMIQASCSPGAERPQRARRATCSAPQTSGRRGRSCHCQRSQTPPFGSLPRIPLTRTVSWRLVCLAKCTSAKMPAPRGARLSGNSPRSGLRRGCQIDRIQAETLSLATSKRYTRAVLPPAIFACSSSGTPARISARIFRD